MSKNYCVFIVRHTVVYSNCYHTIIVVLLLLLFVVYRSPFTGTVMFLMKPRRDKCAASFSLC